MVLGQKWLVHPMRRKYGSARTIGDPHHFETAAYSSVADSVIGTAFNN